ncbi:MAG TPA: glycoside hydrolase domain-containing protein [Planctomycetota bacterium]|nr:glycoside hydrolase domain-containing protein [Planctomycetota bacterium]
MHRFSLKTILALGMFITMSLLAADDEFMISDFEGPKPSLVHSDKFEYVPQNATQGKLAGKAVLDKPRTLEIHFANGQNAGGRWHEFDQLLLDVVVEGANVSIYGFAKDDKATTWGLRYNFAFKRTPGKHRITFPVGGLNRQDGAGVLDPKKLNFFVLGFQSEDPKQVATVYIDNLRLVKGTGGYEVKVLYSFEGDDSGKHLLEDWPPEFKGKSAITAVEEHATHGKKALKLDSRAPAGNVQFFEFDGDWSSYDSLAVDVFSTANEPVGISGWIRDQPGSPYEIRHDWLRVIKPGFNTVKFAVGGLRQNMHPSVLMDIKKIVRFNFAVSNATVFIDNVRLIKGVEEIPVKGMQKFDFGPENSAVFPGFTKVTMKDFYTPEKKWGFGQGSTLGRAFDVIEILGRHRPADDICRDFISPLKATFNVDVPNGKYGVWLMMGPPANGWGLTFNHRTVTAHGKVVLDQKYDKQSYKEHEYFFQDSEDLPGEDIWEKYINHYFKPVVFDVEVTEGKLTIDFDAHGQAWCAMINGLVFWPKESQADAERWLANLNLQRREQFYANHFEETHPAEHKYTKNDADEKRGYARFVFSNQEGLPGRPGLPANFVPSAEHLARTSLDVVAAQGERNTFNLGIYPLKDCGNLKITCTDLTGPNGAMIPASAINPRIARFKAMNTLGRETTYFVAPKYIDQIPAEGISIKPGVTRSFYFYLNVPETAAPGTYKGQVKLAFSNGTTDNVDLTLQVYPFKLVEPDFPLGIFGCGPIGYYHAYDPNSEDYWNEWRELLKLCREYHLTSLDAGIRMELAKWHPEKAEVKFGDADRFMKLMREAGFTQELFGYATWTGFGLKISHLDQQATANRFGAPDYGALVKSYFNAVREQAEKNKWLPICYCTGDEYLARGGDPDKYTELHEILQKNAPGFRFGPGDTAYFGKSSEMDQKILRMLATVDTWWASGHSAQLADAIKKGGKRLFLYNTGISRYTVGTYIQYARRKYNVKGFVQWAWTTGGTYGQFYLGSHNEGCLGMAYPSTRGVRPTPMFESVRAGAVDHAYYETAFNLIERAKKEGKASNEAKELEAYIESVFAPITFGNPNADVLAADGKALNPYKDPNAMEGIRRKLAEGIIRVQNALK